MLEKTSGKKKKIKKKNFVEKKEKKEKSVFIKNWKNIIYETQFFDHNLSISLK